MPDHTLQIPDELLQKLQKRAEDQGRELAAVVIEMLEIGLRYAPTASQNSKLSPEEWVKEFREWVASHPKVDVVVDDSRESIYEGRGE